MLLARREMLRRWGASLVLLGLASLVFTLASGYLAANTLEVDAASVELLAAHERNGWILLALLFVTQFWKAWCGGKVPERLPWSLRRPTPLQPCERACRGNYLVLCGCRWNGSPTLAAEQR